VEIQTLSPADRQRLLDDLGGGDSRLVDKLLAGRFRGISVLDISGEALRKAKERLGKLAGEVTWVERF
jgi:hypothetical protein